MSEEITRFHGSVRNALTNAPAVWTPGCPEPETLLDWIERASAYPQAAPLLDHLMACAYCRRAYTEMCEIRTAARASAAPRRLPSRLDRLSAWVSELMSEGIAAPVRSVRAAIQAMDRLAASFSPIPVRGLPAATDLRPAWTTVRSPEPTLRWSASESVLECSVVVTRHTGRQKHLPVWEGRAGAERQLTLPEKADLVPGGLYLWQVIAHAAGEETACSPVCFAVLPGAARRQLEEIESQTQDGTPERVALYEAFGLYDEALQQVDGLMPVPPSDSMPSAVRARLLQRLPR